MKATASPAARILLGLAAASAALFALTASKCDSSTAFVPFVAEICTDNQDNDEDGFIDCKDSDCDRACELTVTINDFSKPVTRDTLPLSGTHAHATSVVVSVTPSGTGGTAVLAGDTWSLSVTNLSARTTYTLMAVATDAQDRHDTATTTFLRGN